MTSTQQRAALQRQIWQIANDVRGAADGWDFKQYVLGTLFYRFISENFASYIEADDDSVNYAKLPDSVITPDIKDDAIKTKGYFIYPSQLFAKVAASAVNILVLSKHKTDTKTQFIDASGLFKKETNNNVLLDAHIEHIMQAFDSKADVEHFAKSVNVDAIAANDYNLSVSSYIEAKDNREVVDIGEVNAELKITVAKIDQLRKDIDAIVAEIEESEA
jgi:type I restriction-modification system DNA methylase subunit